MYLITGCAGFIGFHMCQYLLKKNLDVIGIDSLNQYYSKKLKLVFLFKVYKPLHQGGFQVIQKV